MRTLLHVQLESRRLSVGRADWMVGVEWVDSVRPFRVRGERVSKYWKEIAVSE